MAAAGPLGIANPVLPGDMKRRTSAAANKSEDSKGWSIPSCAWSSPLGSLPKIVVLAEKDKDSGDVIGLNTPTRAKKGIPLGGIGAGNFMYNL